MSVLCGSVYVFVQTELLIRHEDMTFGYYSSDRVLDPAWRDFLDLRLDVSFNQRIQLVGNISFPLHGPNLRDHFVECNRPSYESTDGPSSSPSLSELSAYSVRLKDM